MYFVLTLVLSLVTVFVFGYFAEDGHVSGYAMYPVVGFIPALITALVNVIFIRLSLTMSKSGRKIGLLLGLPLLIVVALILSNDSSLMFFGVIVVGGMLPVNLYLIFREPISG